MMQAIAQGIDHFNEHLGRAAAWLTLGMVVLMFITVVQRYLFASGMSWEQELVRFFHGMVFLAAAGYTLKHNGHVRVDVVYQRLSERRQAWINLAGTVVFLWPVCAALFWFSTDFVLNAWAIYEGSNEYQGMPGVFIYKTFIWVFCGTLALQGISTCLHSFHTLRHSK